MDQANVDLQHPGALPAELEYTMKTAVQSLHFQMVRELSFHTAGCVSRENHV
jgi:hypothetical protein